MQTELLPVVLMSDAKRKYDFQLLKTYYIVQGNLTMMTQERNKNRHVALRLSETSIFKWQNVGLPRKGVVISL